MFSSLLYIILSKSSLATFSFILKSTFHLVAVHLHIHTNKDNYTLTSDTLGTTIKGTVTNDAGLTGRCSINVKHDTDPPSCSINTSGNKGWNDWYTSNVSASINSPSAHISSKVITNNNSSNYTLTSDTNGTTISGRVTNEAGISGTCSTWVKKDTTRPSCSWSGESTSWTNSNRRVNVSCSDYGSGCNTGTKTWTYSSGTVKTASLSNDIYDNAGNKTTCSKAASVYVDKEGPETPSISNASSLLKMNPVTIECKNNECDIIYKRSAASLIAYAPPVSMATPISMNFDWTSSDSGSGIARYDIYAWGVGSKTGSCYVGQKCDFTVFEKPHFKITAVDNVGNTSQTLTFHLKCATYAFHIRTGELACY